MILYTVVDVDRLLGKGVELSAELQFSYEKDTDFLVKWSVAGQTILIEHFVRLSDKDDVLESTMSANNYYRIDSKVKINI